jgi:hypothetical protein
MKLIAKSLSDAICCYCNDEIKKGAPLIEFPLGGEAHLRCYDNAHLNIIRDRESTDEWSSIIHNWLRANQQSHYSCEQIFVEAVNGQLESLSNEDKKRIGAVMHELDFVKKKKRINGFRPAFYFPPNKFWS